MNSVDEKRTRPTSISLHDDHDDEDHTEEDEEHDGVTFKVLVLVFVSPKSYLLQDIKQILPTCLILIVTVIIMVTVIPYAFSSVIQ